VILIQLIGIVDEWTVVLFVGDVIAINVLKAQKVSKLLVKLADKSSPDHKHLPVHHDRYRADPSWQPSGNCPCCLGFHHDLYQCRCRKHLPLNRYQNLVDLDLESTGSYRKRHQVHRHRNQADRSLLSLGNCHAHLEFHRYQCP